MSNKKKRRPQNQQHPKPQPEAGAIDFDAVRSKKRRTLKKIRPVKIGGREYRLSPTLPLAVTEYFAEHAKREQNDDGEQNIVVLLADMQMILRSLFGEDQWAKISQHIDITEVPALFNLVFDAYSESPGESTNSGQS